MPKTPSTSLLRHILWVGPVIDQSRFSNPAVSAAASIWQQGLIGALVNSDSGVQIEVVSHLPSRAFPKGTLWPDSGVSIFPKWINGFGLQYLNVPLLRKWILKWQYTRNLGKILAIPSPRTYDLIVVYNAEIYVTRPVARAAKKMNIPWVAIIADLPQHLPGPYLDHACIDQSDGCIYLSWKNFRDYGRANKDLLLEGGILYNKPSEGPISLIDALNASSMSALKRIAYFGGITSLGGIDLFLEATQLLDGQQYEFHIIGSGDLARLRPFLERDSRIVYHGSVPQEELLKIGKTIDIFVDPRPKELSENNFPSKILTYLSFGKPVISTLGMGVPPEYGEVLIALNDEHPLSLAELINGIARWDEERIYDYQLRVEEFIDNKKSWNTQGMRALSWLNTLLNRKQSLI